MYEAGKRRYWSGSHSDKGRFRFKGNRTAHLEPLMAFSVHDVKRLAARAQAAEFTVSEFVWIQPSTAVTTIRGELVHTW